MSNLFQSDNGDFGSSKRANIIKYLIIIIASLYICRLGYLQIIKGSKYLSVAEAQAIKQEVIDPFRGNIFDRNGELLVHNEPSFTVKMTPSDFDTLRMPLLSSILGIPKEDIYATLAKYKTYSPFEPVKIARNIDRETALRLEEYLDMLPGIDVAIECKRLYNFEGTMSHLLGYTSEISATQLEKLKYYKPGDIIGKTGLEYTYEDFLRGTKGIRYIAVNRAGQKVSSFNNGKSDEPVINGMDLYLAIDKGAQLKAMRLLQNLRGTCIAIDPNNGEVVVYVSKPDYDLKEMSGRVRPEYYKQLRDDPGKPLLNRGIMSGFPPGSTWKLLVGMAAMQEGLINENTHLVCNGTFHFGNRNFGCHGGPHGSISITTAIKTSCNIFFYQCALKLGLDKLAKYAKMFCFGQKTYIDIPNENKGFFPTKELLDKIYGKGASSYRGRLVNYGIGQGEINVTPIQMAVYIAAIANEGTVYQPHVVKAIYNNLTKQKLMNDYDSKKVHIDKHYFDVIHEGMFRVVNEPGGTGFAAFRSYHDLLKDYKVYGKTGTAQNPHGADHSWFVCFATKNDKPVLAIVCMAENAGFGSTVAAPIAFQVLAKYLKPDYDKSEERRIADSTALAQHLAAMAAANGTAIPQVPAEKTSYQQSSKSGSNSPAKQAPASSNQKKTTPLEAVASNGKKMKSSVIASKPTVEKNSANSTTGKVKKSTTAAVKTKPAAAAAKPYKMINVPKHNSAETKTIKKKKQ